jgi:transcriptional regulator with GAF, ATPase, and Fis domain
METDLLSVWQAVGRHADLGAALTEAATYLKNRLYTHSLLLRHVDVGAMRIETLCAVAAEGGEGALLPRTDLSTRDLESVLAWCRRDKPLRAGRGDRFAMMLATAQEWKTALVVPLMRSDSTCGVLVLLSSASALPDDAESVVEGLREPLSVALGNHLRDHELASLREGLEADRRALLERLDRQDVVDVILGADRGLRDVIARVEQVARTEVPVLLLGETGSGKEVIAREIHKRSRRQHGPIERVNCGAIPPGLIDSELFGHERGSFTGATSTRYGRFERADGGSVFLDEIGELPLEAQVRLLRILQDGTYERVGGHKSMHADVRIIAATHRELERMVGLGSFREDLWYRIGVFPIRIPPLRDRIDDIPEMATHFAWRAGKRLGGSPLVPTTSDVDALIEYPWPGNVRELASVIERAAILGEGRRLDVAGALGAPIRKTASMPASSARSASPPRGETLDEVVRTHIENCLMETNGRVEGRYGAAVRLGVNPNTLRSRMRKLGINPALYRAIGSAGD